MKIHYLIIFFMILSCGVRPPRKKDNTSNNFNLPPEFDTNTSWVSDISLLPGNDSPLVTKLGSSVLFENGSVSTPVWYSTNWYPDSTGGTSDVLTKYDSAIGDVYKTSSTWESQNANQYKNVKWAGHCNGLAAASVMTDAPKHSILYNNVNFTIDDIEGLLIEEWQNSYAKAIGKRCESFPILYDIFTGRAVDETCRGIDPSLFHIVLTNFLGRFHKAIIVNVEPYNEIWNIPIVSYKILGQQPLTVQDVNKWLFGFSEDTYSYNPKATQWVYFQTIVYFSNGKNKTYEYILELNDANEMIGGQWYRGSNKDHPNFIWRPSKPNPEDPYLNTTVVDSIYNQAF